VLIDDLVSKGTDEPYRMFTSRAEYRTLLRQDNADLRLTALGYEIGLASQHRYELMREKETKVAHIISQLREFSVDTSINIWLEELGTAQIGERTRAAKLLLRPGMTLANMMKANDRLGEAVGRDTDPLVLEQAELQIKYEVYIEKEHELVKKMANLEDLMIPETFNYERLSAISTEARQKLMKIKPRTLGQASRISGVNPSDVQILLVFMGR
jgi:tRNA uridine 5-carboxymethylaminomethyl modification enzyme